MAGGICEVVPGFYVCDLHAITNNHFNMKIDLFVSACKCDSSKYDIFLRELRGEFICLKSVTEALDRGPLYLDKELRRGKRIAVFCETGLQRSPSLAMAYLITCGRLSFESAFACLQSKHAGVFPDGRCVYETELRRL